MPRMKNARQRKLDMIEAMLSDERLSGQDLRVGTYVVLKADFDGLTAISQSEIGNAIRVRTNHVSASIKRLCSSSSKYLGRSKTTTPHRYRLKAKSS